MAKVVARDVDEELSLFLEMRRREKVQGVSSLPEPGTKSIDETISKSLVSTTTRCVQLRKSAVEKFLDSENNKSDYEWLLAAPETLGLREQQIRLTGTKSIDETTTKIVSTTTTCVQLRQSAVEKFLDSENNKPDYEWLLAAPETLGEKEAQETSTVKPKQPKARSTALKPRVENIPQETVTRSVKASKQIPRLNTSTAVSKQANIVAEPKANSKLSRPATPTSRTTLPSTRQTNSARNSNPDSGTSSIKSNPRASTTLARSSSVGKSVPSAAKSTSLTIRDIPARPVSASRSRAAGRSTGRSSKISDDVNPVLMGTQMVERVVNMRKLPPPKHDDKMNSGFGRTLSRSSLDMAMRHMNIRRSVSGNPRVTSNALRNSMDKIVSLPSS